MTRAELSRCALGTWRHAPLAAVGQRWRWRPVGRPLRARLSRTGALPSDDMRFRSVVTFGRLIGAAGLGSALGAAVAGLIAIVIGRVDSTFLAALPGLAVLGAGAGTVVARLTRQWFLPSDPAQQHGARLRMLQFAAAGLMVLPLTVAVGQLHAGSTVMIPLMFLGSVITLTLWTRSFRPIHLSSHAARPHARSATW